MLGRRPKPTVTVLLNAAKKPSVDELMNSLYEALGNKGWVMDSAGKVKLLPVQGVEREIKFKFPRVLGNDEVSLVAPTLEDAVKRTLSDEGLTLRTISFSWRGKTCTVRALGVPDGKASMSNFTKGALP